MIDRDKSPICWQQQQPRVTLNTNPRMQLNMKKYLLPLLLVALAFVTSARAQTTLPNIVVILADDLGYDDVGYNGSPDIPTPNIDSIANSGTQCTNGYVTMSFCAPSRAAIMTGRYQQRLGSDSGP